MKSLWNDAEAEAFVDAGIESVLVSNEIVATTASITVISGTFLVVHEKD